MIALSRSVAEDFRRFHRVPPERIRWLSLDHRAGFLLSLVDGTARVEDIVDMSGMAQLEVLRTLVTLLEQGVISVA